MFSHVKNIKTDKRNLLDITTISAIMKIKSYYSDQEDILSFEPNEEHHEAYIHFIKSDN